MSVIVKGMKMPSECARVEDGEFVHCPFVNTDDDCILQSKVTGTWEEMYQNCPLVALPDHHGRLVDVDYFKEHLITCAENGRPLHRMYTELSELIEVIDNVPTIVEAEGEE